MMLKLTLCPDGADVWVSAEAIDVMTRVDARVVSVPPCGPPAATSPVPAPSPG